MELVLLYCEGSCFQTRLYLTFSLTAEDEVCSFIMKGKIMAGFLNTLSVCHWSNKQIVPFPISHYFSNYSCSVGLGLCKICLLSKHRKIGKTSPLNKDWRCLWRRGFHFLSDFRPQTNWQSQTGNCRDSNSRFGLTAFIQDRQTLAKSEWWILPLDA